MSTFLDQISRLHAAEDFFTVLGLSYDPKIVSVNRLHILKRFHDYLNRSNSDGLTEDDLKALYRSKLEQAYLDFTTSDAVTEKVFKVFRDVRGSAFVPLGRVAR